MKLNPSFFSFKARIFVTYVRNFCLSQIHKDFSLMLSSWNFIFFSFPLGLLLSFIEGASLEQTFVCLLVCKGIPHCFSAASAETGLSSQVTPWLCQKPTWTHTGGFISGPPALLRGSTRPGACQHCAFSPAVGLGNRKGRASKLFFCKTVLSILGLLPFPYKV